MLTKRDLLGGRRGGRSSETPATLVGGAPLFHLSVCERAGYVKLESRNVVSTLVLATESYTGLEPFSVVQAGWQDSKSVPISSESTSTLSWEFSKFCSVFLLNAFLLSPLRLKGEMLLGAELLSSAIALPVDVLCASCRTGTTSTSMCDSSSLPVWRV